MKNRLKSLFPFKSTSWYVLLALFIFIIILTLKDGVPMPLGWDNMGYYNYLSELFVDGDLRMPNLDHYQAIMDTYHNTGSLYQYIPIEGETDGFITKYTYGWSLINAPFLYIGHLFAGWLHYPQDGFSAPYKIAAIISSLFYTLLGLILTRKVLLTFFNEKLTALLLVILVLGTNYLHMNTSSTGLSHIYIYTFYASLIWFSISFHNKPSTKLALLIGINLGILMAIRPTEILAAIIPLFYGITTLSDLKTRFLDFFRLRYYWLAMICVIALYSVQLLYWKYTTGHYLVYTYTNPSEGLDFDKPYILEVLFSFRKGWFIYTPVMLLTAIGFWKLYKLKRELFWPLLIFTVVNLYVVSCWTVWWYASSFSQRALEHSYPVYLLVIGFGLMNLTSIKKTLIYGFIGICISLNLFQTWQMRVGILHGHNMTKAYYFSTFGQTSFPSAEQRKLLLIDRDQTHFDNEEEYHLIQIVKAPYPLPLTLSNANPYSPNLQLRYSDLTEKDHLWIKAYATVQQNTTADSTFAEPSVVHLCISTQYKGQTYAWRNTEEHLLGNQKTTLNNIYLTPELRTTDDQICVGLWLQNGPEIQLTDLYYEIYEHN